MLNAKDLGKLKSVGASYMHEFSLSDAGDLSFGSVSIGISAANTPTEIVCTLLEKAETFGREAAWERVLAGEKAADAVADTARSKAILAGFAVAIAEAFGLHSTFCGSPSNKNSIRVEHSGFCTKIFFMPAPDVEFLIGAHGDGLPERMRDAARWSKEEEYNSVMHECHKKGLCVETAWKAHVLCERMVYFFRQGLSAAFLGCPKTV